MINSYYLTQKMRKGGTMKQSIKFAQCCLFALIILPFIIGVNNVQAQYYTTVSSTQVKGSLYSVKKYSETIEELKRPVTLQAKNQSLGHLLERIAQKAGLGIAYNSELAVLGKKKSVNFNNIPVAAALQQVLSGTGFDAALTKMREIVLIKRLPAFETDIEIKLLEQEISGTVSDAETGETLPGVNVLVPNTTIGTFTDQDGDYSLTAPDDADSLRFSYVGYRTTTVAINNRNTINVQLGQQVQAFGEMVVTAFGIEQEQRELGYSVEQIDSEELNSGNNENVVSALQGKIAGVQVTNTGGAPGSSSRILIRGISSLDPGADNQPLFVVDGVPIDNSTITGGGGGRAFSNRASDINPDDIKSVSVLKGASASALYGVRAANGAVIITTKKGQEGGVKINFNSSVGFDRVNRYPEFQEVYGQGFGGEATTSSFWPNWGARIDAVADTLDGWQYNDIWRDAMETGVKVDNSVSVSGGSELATYYGSVSNLMQDGVIPFSDWDRTSVRFSGEISPSEDLKIASSVNYVNSGGNRVPADRFMERLMYWAPNKDVTDYRKPNGTMNGYYSNGNSGTNPIYDARYATFNDNVNRVIGNVNFTYNMADWISTSYRFGLDYYSDQRTNILPGPEGVENENVLSSTGFITEYRINRRDLNSNITVNLKQDLTEKINAKLTLGNDIFDRQYNQIIASGNDFVTPNFFNLSNVRDVSTSQFESQRRLIGVYGDLIFGYNDYLFLNVTGRNDWSSTLPADNRSFFYPSLNLSFVFSDAFDTPDYLSYGKLRASYAQVGKDAGPYSTGITFGSPGQFPLNGQVGYTRNQVIGSPDLKPEITTSIEAGADLRFMEDRIGLDFTWYKANSADQILTVPISNTTGATRLVTNAGEIENRGVEVSLNLTPLQTPNLRWDVRLNYSRNRNEVISIREGIESIFIGSSFGYAGGGASIQLVEGEPFGNLYGSSFARYYPEGEAPEDPLYLDEDAPILIGEDGFPVRNGDDLVLGNAFPDWIGGIYNSFAYKNISLSFLVDIQQGMDVYNQYGNFFTAFGISKETLDRNEFRVFDGVTADGQPNTQEVWLGQGEGPDGRDYGAGYYRNVARGIAANFVNDASFVKLRNAKVAYSLPSGLMESLPFSDITASATVNNIILYTPFDGFDPESRSGPAGTNATGFTGLDHPGVASFIFSLDFSL